MMEVCMNNGGDGAPAMIKLEAPSAGGASSHTTTATPNEGGGIHTSNGGGGKGGAAQASNGGVVIHQELNAIIGKKRELEPSPSLISPDPSPSPIPSQPQGTSAPKPIAATKGAATRGQTAVVKAGASGAVSKSIEEACHAAALEDGVLSGGGPQKLSPRNAPAGAGEGGAPAKPAKQKNGLRRGKWTPEEEAYANRLIVEFKSGLLPLTDGTTLRTFLSKLLNCDPMRISKKFVGSNCIGKQVFRRRQQADMDRLSADDIERSRQELADLERKFLERVAQTNRCKNSAMPGKDIGAGQVAPEILRKEQEYTGPNGQSLPAPMIPPWMLPPSFTPTSASNSVSGAAENGTWPEGTDRPPAEQAGTSSKITPISQGLRRGARNASPDPVSGMPRTDSQDSLAALGRSLSVNGLDLTDLPRNSSLGDLASLNVFGSSPFPSTENLVGLVSGGHPSSQALLPPNSASNNSNHDWQPDSTGSNMTNPTTFFPSASEEASGAASLSGPTRPPVAQRSSDRLARMTRVESATGLSSMRNQAGMSRNTSIDDFLSLVQNGDIPAPDHDMLSNSIFSAQQQVKPPETKQETVVENGAGRGGSYPAPQTAVSFSGIGKSSAVAPAAASADEVGGGGGRGKRARVGVNGLCAGLNGGTDQTAVVAKLKQPKMER